MSPVFLKDSRSAFGMIVWFYLRHGDEEKINKVEVIFVIIFVGFLRCLLIESFKTFRMKDGMPVRVN